MSDPGGGVDGAIFDESDDASEVGWESISGGFEGDFGAMECGVSEGDFFGGDTDIDECTGVGAPAESGGHGVSISGGIGDDGVEVS
ncbi:MAG: hypothetical protein RL215_3055 [Planctomycetota bacterium]